MKSPNWQEARVFVERIAGRPDPAMTFQVFDDKGERFEIAAWRHGKLSDPAIRKWLSSKADQGCGVFFTVSACDGKGRRRKNVVAARAVFIDLDGEPLPDTWEIEPDIINESSPGKFHAYWLIQNEDDLNAFSDCQARLAAFFTGDPKVFDPPRVMRLPGFYHQKNSPPFRSRTLKICDASAAEPFERRELADIAAAHDCDYDPPSLRAEQGRSDEPADGWDSPADIGRARAYLASVEVPAVGNRNNAGYLAACRLNDYGISPELSVDLLEEVWNARLDNPLKEHEIRHVVKSAGRYKASSPGSASVSAAVDEFDDEALEIPEEFDFEAPANPEKDAQDLETKVEFEFEGPDDDDIDAAVAASNAPKAALLASTALTKPGERPKTIKREIGGVSWSFGNEVKAEGISWLWPARIPRGKLTLIAGFPDQGKSQIMLKIAALVTTGGEWPNGEGTAPKGVAVILSSEDDEADTLIPRLAAAGADLSNIVIVRSMVKIVEEGKKRKRVLNIEDDLRTLQAIMKKCHDEGKRVRMIGLDPINAYFGGGKKADSHKNSDMRAMLTPIAEWAAMLRVAIVAITHFNKGSNAHALHRITDSGAITAAARSVYIAVKKHNDDPKAEVERIFAPLKHNLAPDAVKGIAYSISSTDVSAITGVPNPAYGTPFIEFGMEDTTTAEEALAGEAKKRGPKGDELAAAKDFLVDVLSGGPVPTKDLEAAAKGAGVSLATMRRAAPLVGACAVKPKGTFTGQWNWVIDPTKAAGEFPDGDVDQDFEDDGTTPADDGQDMDQPDFG